jgi:hypothetical protein
MSIFWGNVFDMGFLLNYFYGVFELPLPEKKKNGCWVVGPGLCL